MAYPDLPLPALPASLEAWQGSSASFDFFSTAEDVAFLHAFISDWFHSPDVIAAATKYGLATQQQFDDWRLALDQWKSHAGAVGAIAFGEVIACKP